MSLRILGLDLSHVGTGIASIRDGLAGQLGNRAGFGAVKVRTVNPGGRTGDERRHHIVGEISEEFRCEPEVAIIEAVFVGKDPTTGLRLAELHGWVQAALYAHDIPYMYVTTQLLKMYATGKGSGDKSAVLHAARARYADHVGGPSNIRDDNQADALTIAAMCAHAYGHPLVPVPVECARALKSVKWPTLNAGLATAFPVAPGWDSIAKPDGALL